MGVTFSALADLWYVTAVHAVVESYQLIGVNEACFTTLPKHFVIIAVIYNQAVTKNACLKTTGERTRAVCILTNYIIAIIKLVFSIVAYIELSSRVSLKFGIHNASIR